jgi:hypothetical protein
MEGGHDRGGRDQVVLERQETEEQIVVGVRSGHGGHS